MILSMSRVRILGPRDRLSGMVGILQDAGTVHLTRPSAGALRPVPESLHRDEEERLREALQVVEATLEALPEGDMEPKIPDAVTAEDLRRREQLARRLRRRAEDLTGRARELERRAVDLDRFLDLFRRFGELPSESPGDVDVRSWFLVLRTGDSVSTERLRQSLEERLGEGFELTVGEERGEGRAAVLRASGEAARTIEDVLAGAGVEEVSLPTRLPGGSSLEEAAGSLKERRSELRDERQRLERERQELAAEHGPDLLGVRLAIRDRLARIEALRTAAETERAFVLEGWVPDEELDDLRRRIGQDFGDAAALELIATEKWRGEEAPVALSNPRIFRPFEAVTRMLPLPTYGSIDPTPYVAVFFPMFFGIILGDMAYGLALGALAAWLHHRSDAGSTLRSVSEVAGACAAFTVVFGFVYGEFLGDLGHRLFALEPLIFDRQEALIPFLGLAMTLGVVHVLIGFILGAVSSVRDEPREAVGRGLYALMVVLVAVALLAAVRVLPGAFFTPAVVALLVAFPVLIIVEGVLAPVELISALGNVLSYARIMALGTASVVMAVVANELVGTVGSVLVGALFGLLFHLVNFALGVFGPTIHGLRLHYVEFFDKFYSPGGEQYRPFRHVRPEDRAAASLDA